MNVTDENVEAIQQPVAVKPPFEFDRYINGTLMAEGVTVELQDTLEGAMRVAARIASRGPNGEVPVLVLRTTPPSSLREENERLQASAKHISKMAESNIEYWKTQYEKAEARVTAAEAKIAKLEAALKPFANAKTADGLKGGFLRIPDGHPVTFKNIECTEVEISIGDLRRARAALGQEVSR